MAHRACGASLRRSREYFRRLTPFVRGIGLVAVLAVGAPAESSWSAEPAAAPAVGAPVAVAARLVDQGGRARLTFDLSNT